MVSLRHLLIALLCLAWIVPGLVGHDPWKPDEAFTFGVVYELLKGGSWVVPHLAGEVFLHEPPFYHLTAAASAILFSPLLPLHDAARLATGFYMGLAIVFCGLASRELHGVRHGLIAVLLLIGCFGLVVRSHQLITDIAAFAGFAMAYYGFALSSRRVKGGLWIGTGLGLVFMTQGVLETAIIAVMALALLVASAWRNRTYAIALAAAAAAALPWLLIWPLLLHNTSPALFHEWLWTQNFEPIVGGEDVGAGLLYYLKLLPWYAWPVWPIAVWALWSARITGYARPTVVLPVIGFVTTLGLLSLGPARELHALPLLLPLALLATPAADALRRGAGNAWYWFSVMGFTFFVIVAWFYWTGLELGVPARLHGHLHRIQPGYPPSFKPLPFALAAAYTLAWLSVVVGLKRGSQRPVIVWAAGITTIWALMAILFIGWVDAGKSYRPMVAGLTKALPKKYDCIASKDLSESPRAMLHYFGGIITYREEVKERRRQCSLLLVQGHPRYEVPPRGKWRKIWEGGRIRDKDEIYRLYQRR